MFNLPSLHQIVLMLPAIVVGLTFHEYAHGLVAHWLGDDTARLQGRLTINPAAHVDPVGLLMLFLAGFGWAKPVPVNPLSFTGDMRRGMLLVSLAGPVMNIVMAVVAVVVHLALMDLGLPYFTEIMFYIIYINIVLAIFNLLPIPPLDGSKILAGILPGRQEWLYHLESYGIIILILLVFTGAIGYIFRIFVIPLANILLKMAQII
ncbi:MAG: site-2 protease family protein [Peptococcaceae bacterium]|nr:site-2 protease family protein [Candidatus Syntrophopropionicum ammoniitolerans]